MLRTFPALQVSSAASPGAGWSPGGWGGRRIAPQAPGYAATRYQTGSRAVSWSSSRNSVSSSRIGSSRNSGGSGTAADGKAGSNSKRASSCGKPKDPPLQLQSWLQEQQGVPVKEAGRIAERLAAAFGGDEQAALASLPATFAWCRSQQLSTGLVLTGLQVAEVLVVIASHQYANVVNFASTAQHDWQLIDSLISVHVQQKLGCKLLNHSCLADVLRSRPVQGTALSMQPGHVAAWIAAARRHLSEADVGALLLAQPYLVSSAPETAAASIAWVRHKLGVTDVGRFFRRYPGLLIRRTAALQENLRGMATTLQQVGLSTDEARQLAADHPGLLDMKPATLRETATWLQQRIPAGQLLDVLLRGPQLLKRTSARQQSQEDCLRQQLGWDSNRVADFIKDYPQSFTCVDLSKPDTAAKLRFLTEVVGVASEEECIARCSSYLKTSLQSMAALHVLFCEHAPQLLLRCDAAGRPILSWMHVNESTLQRSKLSRQRINEHVLKWPASEVGQQLLAELRAGDTSNWPRPAAIPPEASK
ncbi:hypothetical protein ABPG75_005111 [Micractinium tetrahymenae]